MDYEQALDLWATKRLNLDVEKTWEVRVSVDYVQDENEYTFTAEYQVVTIEYRDTAVGDGYYGGPWENKEVDIGFGDLVSQLVKMANE